MMTGLNGNEGHMNREPALTTLRELIRADLTAMCEGEHISRLQLAARLALHARWRAVVLWRIANSCMANPFTKAFALWLADRVLAGAGAELQPGATIGPGVVLKHTAGLVVGRQVRAGERLTLHQNVTLGDKHAFGGQPTLGDDVTVGAGACVLGPVHVGDRVTIAANSVVTGEVPSDCTVAGVPARVVGTREAGQSRAPLHMVGGDK